MRFVIGFDADQYFDGVIDTGFFDVNFLETTRQGPVFFKVTAEFLISGGTDAT